ncbi:MAG: MFS transporter [Spirosomataceae bacterium]
MNEIDKIAAPDVVGVQFLLKSERLKPRMATFTLFFLLGVIFASWASRIPDIQEKLHIGVAELGGVLLGMPIGSLTSVLITGFLVERFGSKLVCILSTLLSCTALIGLGLAPSALTLAFVLAVFGAADNILNIAMNTQAIGVEKLYGRTLMSTFHAVWSLGAMAGAAIGGIFATSQIEPPLHFACIFLFVIVGLVLISRWLLTNDTQSGQKGPLFSLPDQSLWILSIICLCAMMTEGAMADWSAIYYKQSLSKSGGSASMGYTAFALIMSIGRFTGDYLTNRFGITKMLIVSGGLISLGIGIALLYPVSFAIILGLGLVGAGVACVVPIAYSAAGKSKTMSAGMALNAVSTIGYTGFLVGPPLIGFLADASSLRIALGIIMLLGAAILLLASKASSTA